MRHTLNRLLIISLLLALTGGCASNAPALIGAMPPNNPALAQVREHPDEAIGKTVRWGGIIAKVDNQETETWIEIVDKTLQRNGAPADSDKSQGRFIARITGFVDPMIYEKGRRLTVYGVLEQAEVHHIGNFTYLFPVVRVKESHLWAHEPDMVYFDPWPIWYEPWYPRSFSYHYRPLFYYW